jgi:hypothetical protein
MIHMWIIVCYLKMNIWKVNKIGAVHEARTRDLDLGKVALYQLS